MSIIIFIFVFIVMCTLTISIVLLIVGILWLFKLIQSYPISRYSVKNDTIYLRNGETKLYQS